MKMRLKKPIVERKWATSPRLALPRNILNSTWMGRRDLLIETRPNTVTQMVQPARWSNLVESWCWGRSHSQCHAHKWITIETVSISHHDNTCDGHYGCHNLQSEIQSHQWYQRSSGERKAVIESIIMLLIRTRTPMKRSLRTIQDKRKTKALWQQ